MCQHDIQDKIDQVLHYRVISICYLNFTFYLEAIAYFQVVGRKFDTVNILSDSARFHETIYSLLDDVSPTYRNSFSEILTQKLQQLQHQEEHESMDTK